MRMRKIIMIGRISLLLLLLSVGMHPLKSMAAGNSLVSTDEWIVEQRFKNRTANYPSYSKKNQGKLLLAGSSSMSIWGNAENNPLKKYHPLNMAVPGSTSGQWVKWYKKAIVAYKPKAIVFYAGVNDGVYTRSRAEKTAGNVKKLIGLLRKALPKTPVFYISLVPTPKRVKKYPDTLRYTAYANTLIQKYCNAHRGVTFLSIDGKFKNHGKVKTSLFGQDGIHPNSQGLKIWNQYVGSRVAGAVRKLKLNVGKVYYIRKNVTDEPNPTIPSDDNILDF